MHKIFVLTVLSMLKHHNCSITRILAHSMTYNVYFGNIMHAFNIKINILRTGIISMQGQGPEQRLNFKSGLFVPITHMQFYLFYLLILTMILHTICLLIIFGHYVISLCRPPANLSVQYLTWLQEYDRVDADVPDTQNFLEHTFTPDATDYCDAAPPVDRNDNTALCPWRRVKSVDTRRVPRELVRAQCECASVRMWRFGLANCQPVWSDVPVLRMVDECSPNGEAVYVKTFQRIAVACHAVIKRRRLSRKKSVEISEYNILSEI